MRSKHGFTLVELIIVIAVIGVLAAILIPSFSNVIEKANSKSALSDARNLITIYTAQKLEDDTSGGSKSYPENIVITVNKANKYYLFGYNTQSGLLMISNDGKGFDKDTQGMTLTTKNDLLQSTLIYNNNHSAESFDSEKDNYILENDGAIYLESYSKFSQEQLSGFDGIFKGKDNNQYRELTVSMPENISDNVNIYHGALLKGTFSQSADNNQEAQQNEQKTIQIKFYDTWNEEIIDGTTIKPENNQKQIEFSAEWPYVPEYWVQQSETTAQVKDGIALFKGERHNKSVEGDNGVDYIVVTTSKGLEKISGAVSSMPNEAQANSNLSKNYWLANDISAADIERPIGFTVSGISEFKGKFNGNNKTISDLNLTFNNNSEYVGLFAINSGTISNFNLSVKQIKASKWVGGVCGKNIGRISAVDVGLCDNGIWAAKGIAGGIAGENVKYAVIYDCSAYSLQNNVSYNVSGGSENGYCTTDLDGISPKTGVFIGGITGINVGTIQRCGVGDVNNKFGISSKTSNGEYGCWNGGITGLNYSEFGNIKECYAYYVRLNCNENADSTYAGLQKIGGIAGGNSGCVENCFAYKTKIICNSAGGGFIGENMNGGRVKTSWVYIDINCSVTMNNNNDDIGINNGTVTSCYIWCKAKGENGFNSSVYINATSMHNKIPSGFSNNFWTKSSDFAPKLKNNPLRSY